MKNRLLDLAEQLSTLIDDYGIGIIGGTDPQIIHQCIAMMQGVIADAVSRAVTHDALIAAFEGPPDELV